MPVLAQGDIFSAVSRAQMTIVFGHFGFTLLKVSWDRFLMSHPSLKKLRDPFKEIPNQPFRLNNECYLWFVPDGDERGLTDSQLEACLDDAVQWASTNRIRTIATNGVANTDHRHDLNHDRRSDERRAAYLKRFAAEAEQRLGIDFELINMSDIFVRDCNPDPKGLMNED